MQYDLWHYQVQLRRIAAHREKGVEAEIRKAYQDVLIELQAILGKYYAGYGDPETSILTRGDLQAAGQYKNFLEDVLSHLDGLGEPMERKIRKTVEDTYTTCYTGMAAAVQQVTAGNATLQSLFGGALAITPETVRHIVEYPIPKLTLSTVFQRRRKQIVSDIQKTLAVGLASGDSYTKMAGRIAKILGGNEKKARTIVRTEANRAISRGFQDVAEETAALLDGTGYVDVKTWRSMLDGDVRDTHRHLNGKTVHALEQFESKSGAKADCPGHFGVAEEDINCRCILVYSIMSEEEFVAQGGTLPRKSPKKEGQLQLITESDGTFSIKKAGSGLTPTQQNGIIKKKSKYKSKYSATERIERSRKAAAACDRVLSNLHRDKDGNILDKSVRTAAGKEARIVKKTTLHEEPNSITQVVNGKGGVNRNYYNADGNQFLQISNNGHGNASEEDKGIFGEHAHDYFLDETGKLHRKDARELTEAERTENGDVL